MTLQRAEKMAYFLALGLVVYMPLHIFLAQSLSLVTGGLEVWKAAKDVLLVFSVFPLLFLAYKQGSFGNKFFKLFMWLGVAYVAIYMLFLLFDKNADTKASITGAVYNTRLLGYFLLGWVVAGAKNGNKYTHTLLKVLLLMCGAVALFGVAQYFLPKDLLTHVGYSLERGVKPMFFIDDKPDFPRVMSTLRDPNSLGAFLALPIVYAVYSLFVGKRGHYSKVLQKSWTKALLIVCVACLIFTFSRSGLITVLASVSALLLLSSARKISLSKKNIVVVCVVLASATSLLYVARNTYTVQNVLLHADKSTVEVDPNQLRLNLYDSAVAHIVHNPFGEGPGSAGIVSLGRTTPAVLTENYYLQIAYEVGVVGAVLYAAISVSVLVMLYKNRDDGVSLMIFSVGAGVAVFGLFNHSWSNEALALQWWLAAGLAAVTAAKKYHF